MRKKREKVKTCYYYLKEHIDKLRKISEESDVPVSALLKRILTEYFEKNERTHLCNIQDNLSK